MRKNIALGLLIFSLCLPGTFYAQTQSKEEEVFFIAKKAFEDGYYEAGIGLLNRFLADFPRSSKAAEAELLLGQSYFYQNNLIESLNKFEALLNKPYAANIKDAVSYWIAEAYFKSNNFPKAAEAYGRVIKEFPNSAYASLSVYSLGWSLFEEGKFQEALGYFRIMEDKYPKEPQALDASFKIVECLYNLKDYSSLKDKARQLIKPFSKDAVRLAYLYFYIAESEFYSDNFTQALEFFKKALKEGGDAKIQVLSRLGTGWSYLRIKDYKKAETEFAMLKEASLDKARIEVLLLGKAEAFLRQGKLNEARVEFERAAKISDNKTTKEASLVQAADIYFELGEYTEAINLYRAISVSYPVGSYKDYVRKRTGQVYYALGLGYFQNQDYDASIKIMERYRREMREGYLSAEEAYLLGTSYYNAGNFSKAVEYFNEVISKSPDILLLQKAEYGIADSMYYLGNEKEALARFNALRCRYPGSKLTAKAIFWLAGYYYQHDELDLASRYFLSLTQDFPKSELAAESYYSMGLISMAKGKNNEAAVFFKKAAEIGEPDFRSQALFSLAEVFESSGNLEMAVKEYLRVS
ncbi:MAG: tetratricopeptide repeat protein, partial [Candidatus Omnitrophica bacterium]|nr:tetratricopeptide repeat protein [Candidatus Omnitrophota bacterium]